MCCWSFTVTLLLYMTTELLLIHNYEQLILNLVKQPRLFTSKFINISAMNVAFSN